MCESQNQSFFVLLRLKGSSYYFYYFFVKSIASKCRFRILVFHLKPHAAAVLESASPACLNASNCVFPVRICLNTISVNILSSSFVQPSCLFLLILFLLHHLYYYM